MKVKAAGAAKYHPFWYMCSGLTLQRRPKMLIFTEMKNDTKKPTAKKPAAAKTVQPKTGNIEAIAKAFEKAHNEEGWVITPLR